MTFEEAVRTIVPAPKTLAFTGPRALSAEQAGVVATFVSWLPPGTKLVVGCCTGLDITVARAGMIYQYPVHAVVPAKRDYLAVDWKLNCTTYEELPWTNVEPHRARNERMVEICDTLVAWPALPEDHPKMRRSGTWMTIRIARRMGRAIVEMPLYHP